MTNERDTDESGTRSERRALCAGYQGREGSFGARAAAVVGRPVARPTFESLLEALVAGEVDEAPLPAVDRVVGPVVEALSPLGRAVDEGERLVVLGEVEVPIRLVLAAPRGVGIEGIATVHSQAPVLRQCAALVSRLGARAVEEDDTADAAVRESKAKGAVWLGPSPDVPRRPRVEGLPRATDRRPPTVVTVGPFRVGGGARAVIAGPCAVESEEQVGRLARAVARAGATALRGGVFKPRTSPYAFQGHGHLALGWLKAAGESVGLPVVTEVMAPAQVGPVAELADVLQVGARNCQNYDLLKEAGAAGRPVLLKRGFGTTVDEWLSSAEYLLDAGCEDVMLCERGIRTFESSTRSTLDLGGLLAARGLTHLPLLADPSHAAGRRELVPGLARAAWGAGVDGLIVEVHDAPESAWCDGPQALLPEDLDRLCDELGLLPGATLSVERVRTAIDSVDREIGRLVARRLQLCRRVAEAKRAAGVPLRDEAREETVVARYLDTPGIDEGSARSLAASLISMGLTVEGWSGEGAA